MRVKETIAFLGNRNEVVDELAERLVAAQHPLVLIHREADNWVNLGEQLERSFPGSDVELITCTREACWESEIVLLTDACELTPKLFERIKEVANQKTLVYLTTEKNNTPTSNAHQCLEHLPHTQLVRIDFNQEPPYFLIQGGQPGTKLIDQILKEINYQTKIKTNNA